MRLFMARGERTAQEVADGLGVRTNQLYRWHTKYRAELSGATAKPQGEDVEALRRRLRRLEQENAILKKAAAFFAQDSL